MRHEVVAAVVWAPRAVAVVGTATRVEEAAAAPVIPAVVAMAAVAGLMAAVSNAK